MQTTVRDAEVIDGVTEVKRAQHRLQPGTARERAKEFGQLLAQARVPIARSGDHVQNALPYLVETVQAGDPPTLLERVQLIGVRIQHHRGHREARAHLWPAS
jgi:hypothetical protein